MTLPGFTAQRALVPSTTAWSGRARAPLETAAVRIAILPGGTECGPCPPGSGPGQGGYYWCCSPTNNGGTLCQPHSCDPCSGFIHICRRLQCICENTGGQWLSHVPPCNGPCGCFGCERQ